MFVFISTHTWINVLFWHCTKLTQLTSQLCLLKSVITLLLLPLNAYTQSHQTGFDQT